MDWLRGPPVVIRPHIQDWLSRIHGAELTAEEGAYIIEHVKMRIRTPPCECKILSATADHPSGRIVKSTCPIHGKLLNAR